LALSIEWTKSMLLGSLWIDKTSAFAVKLFWEKSHTLIKLDCGKLLLKLR
jgi:hypothetical protein